jgi:pyrrolidone-carboxylate peptidase
VSTLLTGFDPFTGREGKPAEGEWNPSGAAVLELDGKSIDAEAGVTAAVEGIVLPVSFDEFRAGLVERIIKPQMGSLDAVLTVSLDNSITTGAVRMERFAVGVHKLDDGKLERIPAAPGGTEGPRIIEAPAPIDKIATDTEQKDKDNKVVVQKPAFGNDIKLKFHSAADANKARAELNMTAVNSDELVIDNPATVRLISTTAKIALTSAIHFQVVPKGTVHEADLLRGPGGDFLSNEVSYRVQRLLAESKSPRDPVSFHTHVPGTGELLPADAKTPEGKAVLARAKELRDKLITTLKSMIAAVARIIAHR